MRKAHLAVGILAVLAFLTTGQLIRHHEPPLSTMAAEARLLFRSRHIYILAAALVNLMLGLYAQPQSGWRGATRSAGSVLVMLSPVLLVAAFAVEPAHGFRQDMWWSASGLYTLFAGSMAHLASAIGQSALEPKARAQSHRA